MIDQSRVEELRGEVGPDDLVEVVVLFCGEIEETLQRATILSQNSPAEDLHFLKGCALNIGMPELANLCKAAELAIRSDPAFAPDFQEIARAYHEAKSLLQAELGISS